MLTVKSCSALLLLAHALLQTTCGLQCFHGSGVGWNAEDRNNYQEITCRAGVSTCLAIKGGGAIVRSCCETGQMCEQLRGCNYDANVNVNRDAVGATPAIHYKGKGALCVCNTTNCNDNTVFDRSTTPNPIASNRIDCYFGIEQGYRSRFLNSYKTVTCETGVNTCLYIKGPDAVALGCCTGGLCNGVGCYEGINVQINPYYNGTGTMCNCVGDRCNANFLGAQRYNPPTTPTPRPFRPRGRG